MFCVQNIVQSKQAYKQTNIVLGAKFPPWRRFNKIGKLRSNRIPRDAVHYSADFNAKRLFLVFSRRRPIRSLGTL